MYYLQTVQVRYHPLNAKKFYVPQHTTELLTSFSPRKHSEIAKAMRLIQSQKRHQHD